MDETIGAKGGSNDRKRSLKITLAEKKKLQERKEKEEIIKLEKEVKKKQYFVLLGSLPIAVAGTTFKTLYETATSKSNEDKSTWEIKEYDADFTTKERKTSTSHEKEITIIPRKEKNFLEKEPAEENNKEQQQKKKENNEQINPERKEEKQEEKKEQIKPEEKEIKKQKDKVQSDFSFEEVSKVENLSSKKEDREEDLVMNQGKKSSLLTDKKEEKQQKKILEEDFSPVFIENQDFIPLPQVKITTEILDEETLKKIKAKKIIDEYEIQLKDIRYELRNLIFEYHVLESSEEKTTYSEGEEKLLDRLSEVIEKIKALKQKLEIEDYEAYDDQSVYDLIQEYILEFRKKEIVEDIEDSPLYILISEKIAELDSKKDIFEEKILEKQEKFKNRESHLSILKEKYYDFEKLNQELLNFQLEQEQLLKEIKQKIENATTIQEKTEIKVNTLNKQSRKLLRLLTFSTFLRGKRSAKSMATTVAAYLYFSKNILQPETVTKKYQVIQVKDYSSEIEESLSSLQDASSLLRKTDQRLDKMMIEMKEEFKDILDTLPECKELFSRLEKVKSSLHEKEYEMEKIQKEQKLLLEENQAKVLKRGEYPL